MATTLLQDFQMRPPTMDDAGAVADIIGAADVAMQCAADYAAPDVRDDWRQHYFELQRDAWLVTTATGQVVAYAGLFHEQSDRLYVDACVHPDYAGRGIGAFLLGTAERRAHERLRAAPVDTPAILGQGINARNEAARRLLEGAGYRHVRTFWHMRIALDDAPPAPLWPAGLAVRAFVPDADDYKVWAAGDEAFQDHWEHHTEPFEQWRQQRLSREGFEPSLWFLALDGDEVAGIILCRYRLEIGWVGTLGVRRRWRGQGLGLALLRHAFGEFYRRGAREVGLGVDAQILTGATRLYERAGMRVERQYDIYDKELQTPLP